MIPSLATLFPAIDPVAFAIGPLLVRWYSLAYIAGFLGGWGMARALARRSRLASPTPQQIDDFLLWIILAVMLGGRIGYILFYNLPHYLSQPADMLKIWHGGMSFHGGLAGVAIAVIIYSTRQRIPVLRLGDLAACGATIGLFFGRIANFINGELYGRVTTSNWGIIFPDGGPLPRHPSQLYEAASEGLLLFVILNGLAWFCPSIQKRHGFLFGVFLAFYGCARFLIEFVREPDPQIGLYFDTISQGQILCLPMILSGMALMLYAWKRPAHDHSSSA